MFDVDILFEPIVDVATANHGYEARGVKRRRAGAESAKTRVKARGDVGDTLPSFKLKRPLKGASSLDYQEMLKVEAAVVASRF